MTLFVEPMPEPLSEPESGAHAELAQDRARWVIGFDVIALLAWAVGCRYTTTEGVGTLGLVTSLSAAWWVAIVILVVGFVLAYRANVSDRLLLVQPVLLAVMLLATPALIEPFARVPTGYVHAGLVEHIVRTGANLGNFDARYSWPGALDIGALTTLLGGVGNATAFLKWSPLAFVLLDCLVLHSIGRTLLSERRQVALALWLFVSINWVGQDYWSPQALNFLLVLVFIATVLRWVPTRAPENLRSRVAALWMWRATAPAATSEQRRLRPVLTVALPLLGAAVATSHQLTPFFLVAVALVLAVVGRRDLGSLPLVLALMTIGWISWGATSFWMGNSSYLVGDVGKVGNVIGQGVTARVNAATSTRDVVLWSRVAFAVVVWGSAVLAALWKRRAPATPLLASLMLVSFPLVAMQSYGGELPLRIFLFTSPFAALLLAAAIGPVIAHAKVPSLVPVVVLTALLAGCVFCRWGNEAFEQVYPADIAATEFVYDQIPDGQRAFVIETNPFSPFRSERVDTIRYLALPLLARPELVDPVDVFLQPSVVRDWITQAGPGRSYVVITRAQVVYGREVLGAADGWDAQLVESLTRAGVGRVVFAQDGATVLEVRP